MESGVDKFEYKYMFKFMLILEYERKIGDLNIRIKIY